MGRRSGRAWTRLRAAGLEPAARDGRTTRYDPQLALPVLFDAGDPRTERARLDRARAELAELELARRRGDSISATEAAHITAIQATVRDRMLLVPRLAPACRAAASDAEGVEVLADGCRAALTELARLGDLAGAAAAASLTVESEHVQ